MEDNIQNELIETREPEDAIAIAKYLLELIQQDLNMGRKETIAPRLTKAVNTLINLQNIFPAIKPPPVIISDETAKEYYSENGYCVTPPQRVGLYKVATKGNGWFVNYVAVTLSDYREFLAHDDFGVVNVNSYGAQRGGAECYWLKVN